MKANYQDASLPVELRVNDLLGRLTLAEKVGQVALPLGWAAWEKRAGALVVSDLFRPLLGGDGLGMLYGVLRADPWTGRTLETGLNPREGAEATNLLQRFAIENTRHGIPLLFVEECVQGVMANGSTIFPPGLTMASTWNTELLERVAQAVRAEATCRGITIALGPVLDLLRDPRWSRAEEMLGEDPHLATQLGLALLRGLQNLTNPAERPLLATLKHFAAHGEPEGGHNAAPAHIGARELHEVLLAPFRAAIREGGARVVMSSYNEVDGQPCSGSRELLTGILRDDWKFNGIVVSDCYSVEGLVNHGVATDAQAAGALAISAGLDSVMTDIESFQKMQVAAAVQAGQLRGADLDESVRRILRLKFSLGLFENPYVDAGLPPAIVGCPAHVELCRQTAREGIVLLKNENQLLPLAKELPVIAVIGPNADNPCRLFGHYVGPQPRAKVKTVLDGIREAVSPRTVVRYARGCEIRNPSRDGIAEAVTAAAGASVAIVVIGGSSGRDYGVQHAVTGAAIATGSADIDCGEGHDRSDLTLLGGQLELLQALQATGTPLVVVYLAGRPLQMDWAAQHAPALLTAWYPGEQGGAAIADVLFGDYNPAGRLPVSIPRSVGQLPIYYNHKPSARRDYITESCQPQFPFGFGLSYTTFAYRDLCIEPAAIPVTGRATVSVTVTNTGTRAGHEVVQLYVTDVLASTTRPVRELKAFGRVHLQPGDSQTVRLELPAQRLELLDAAMRWVVEPGQFRIHVGSNQTDGLTGLLQVLPA